MSVPTPTAEPALAARLRETLGTQQYPAAAVVLSPDGKLLGMAGVHGASPTRDALRPGSTLKPLLTLIAARGGIEPRDSYTCVGKFAEVEGLTCFAEHGPLDLPGAIEQSCNTYFFDIAHRLGLQRIYSGFESLGFGRPTGLADGESAGRLVQEPELRARQPEQLSDGLWPAYAPMIGTGHGPIQVTLLQLTVAYAHLARELGTSEEERGPENAIKLKVLAGLRRVVGAKGTGRTAAVAGLDIAGKTGSAEPGQFDDGASQLGARNGWFVGFAPASRAELIVGVVSIGSDFSGASAAPLAGAIFAGELSPERAEQARQ